jgi:hypothetical protein
MINAGTRVTVMRETATGVIARFGGREVVIPLMAFRPLPSQVEPTPRARSTSSSSAADQQDADANFVGP